MLNNYTQDVKIKHCLISDTWTATQSGETSRTRHVIAVGKEECDVLRGELRGVGYYNVLSGIYCVDDVKHTFESYRKKEEEEEEETDKETEKLPL